MQYRDQRGRYTSKGRKLFSVLLVLWSIVGVIATAYFILDWYQEKFVPEPTEVLSPVADPEPELSEWEQFIETLDPVERAICEAFPVDQCKIALAVTQSENGARDPEALHANLDGSFDVGIMQINSQHWNTDYCPGLHELTTVGENIKCGRAIWDRRDGTPDDGQGSWAAWSDFNNGKFVSKL